MKRRQSHGMGKNTYHTPSSHRVRGWERVLLFFDESLAAKQSQDTTGIHFPYDLYIMVTLLCKETFPGALGTKESAAVTVTLEEKLPGALGQVRGTSGMKNK
jgi:hypothetical protein